MIWLSCSRKGSRRKFIEFVTRITFLQRTTRHGGEGRQPLAFGAGFCVYLNYEHDSRSLTLSNDYHQQFTFFEIDRAQRDTATKKWEMWWRALAAARAGSTVAQQAATLCGSLAALFPWVRPTTHTTHHISSLIDNLLFFFSSSFFFLLFILLTSWCSIVSCVFACTVLWLPHAWRACSLEKICSRQFLKTKVGWK